MFQAIRGPSCVLLATLVAAQESYEVNLIDDYDAFPVKLVSGRFSGRRLSDVAALLSNGNAQIVFQPKTWSFPYDLRVENANDMARVPGIGPNDEDRLLVVGGGYPRLSKFVSTEGYEMVTILVTGWHTVARVEAVKYGSEYRIAGLKTGTGQLRFGVLDPTEDDEGLDTVGVQTVTDPVLDMQYADWDANGSAPELLVLTTNGLLVYDWSGNLRADGPAPFLAVEGHLADVEVGPRKVVWLHRAAAGTNWLCHAGSSAGVVAATLPAVIGAKAVRALSGAGATQPNALMTVLEDAGVADAVVVEFDGAGLGSVDWEADVPDLGVPCGGFSDLDGDSKCDALWAKSSSEVLQVVAAPPAASSQMDQLLRLHYFREPTGKLILEFDSEVASAVVRAFHQPILNQPVDSVGAITTGPLVDGEMDVNLPAAQNASGIFILELELGLYDGQWIVLLFPYVHDKSDAGVEVSYAISLAGDNPSAEPISVPVPDPRRISIIPRPLRINLPPTTTPPSAD